MRAYLFKEIKPHHVYIALMWLFVVLAIALTPGCKARKVNKSESLEIDKSFSEAKVIKKDSTGTKSGESAKITEITKDSSGSYIKKTKEYFLPDEKTPPNSLKSETEETWSGSKAEKAKVTDIDSFSDHSELQELDSIDLKINDIKKESFAKVVETKDNTVYMWIGAGLFVGIVIIVLGLLYRKKPGL